MKEFFRTLTSALRRLVQSWWGVDRIRVAPSTGRLLSLQTGDTVVLFDEIYSVARRKVFATNDGHEVVCELTHADGEANLRMLSSARVQHATHAKLVADGTVVDVFDDDVFIVRSE